MHGTTKRICFAVVIGVALQEVGADPQSGAPASTAPTSPAPAPIALRELADRVDRAYREARAIRIEGRTIVGEDVLEYRYDGTHDSFQTLCLHNGDDVYGAFSLHNGRVQEFVPRDRRHMVLTYDAEGDSEIPHLLRPRLLDCHYGVMFGVWIGLKSARPESFARRIREGRSLPPSQVDGRWCHVVEWTVEVPPDNELGFEATTISHVYYIDAEDFVVRRWDTSVGEERRTRVYSVMDLSDDVPDLDWDVWPLVQAALQDKSQKAENRE